MESVDMKELVGQVFKFYGVGGLNEFKLGPTVYEAMEDENDGYRSALEDVVVVVAPTNHYPKERIALVRVEEADDVRGIRLVDVCTGHIWLTVGTDDYEDWYPCFVFRYEPDPSRVVPNLEAN